MFKKFKINPKILILSILMILLMSVSVSASYTDYFARADETPINTNSWVNLYQTTGLYRDIYVGIDDEHLVALTSLENASSATAYFNQNLSLPINITFDYWSRSTESYPAGYKGIYLNQLVSEFANFGIGILTNQTSTTKDNTNVHIQWQTDGTGAYIFVDGTQVGFQSNFSTLNGEDSEGYLDHNKFRFYMNETFIGLKNWDDSFSEPTNFEFFNDSLSINLSNFYNSHAYVGADDGNNYAMALFVDNFTIDSEIVTGEPCFYSDLPTETECDNLFAGYYNSTNQCSITDVLECYTLVEAFSSEVECSFSETPTYNECETLRVEYEGNNNDCTAFLIVNCYDSIPENTDIVEELETLTPDIFTKVQKNIKFIMAIGLIIGLISLMAQYTENSLMLVFTGIIATLLSVVLGLISAKYLIYIIITFVVIIILAIVFGNKTKD